jgi:hypothetical protein
MLAIPTRLTWKSAGIHIRDQNERGRSTTRKIVFSLFVICCFAYATRGEETDSPTATVRGTVFAQDSAGNRSGIAGAKVKLTGPAALETETDDDGNYLIVAVPAGTYTITAASPGLEVQQTIQIAAGEICVSLELKPTEIASSVTVTADAAETKGPAASNTISDTTLRDAPSVDERFESSLPLVPGVVRGPDGHVNLKGTRNTQTARWSIARMLPTPSQAVRQ